MNRKITVFGTHDIPGVLGGVETHCQDFYPTIRQQSDVDVCAITRSPYANYKRSIYKKVETYALWVSRKRSLEATVHSVITTFRARIDHSNTVHIHATGPGLAIPLSRAMGREVVLIHHGPGHDRRRQGYVAKKALLLGKRWAVGYANRVIAISKVTNQLIQKKHSRHGAHLIHNGVNEPRLLSQLTIGDTLSRFGLQPKNHLVAVGRFMEGKRVHNAITTYQHDGPIIPLVPAGDADHLTEYSVYPKRLAINTPGVVMIDFLRGGGLQAILSQAKLFAMPLYHERLSITLLETMSSSFPAVVNDIPANLKVQLPTEAYFRVEDVTDLVEKLDQGATAGNVSYGVYLQNYNWREIAKKTVNVHYSIDRDIGQF